MKSENNFFYLKSKVKLIIVINFVVVNKLEREKYKNNYFRGIVKVKIIQNNLKGKARKGGKGGTLRKVENALKWFEMEIFFSVQSMQFMNSETSTLKEYFYFIHADVHPQFPLS